jgi:hypothetical protein
MSQLTLLDWFRVDELQKCDYYSKNCVKIVAYKNPKLQKVSFTLGIETIEKNIVTWVVPNPYMPDIVQKHKKLLKEGYYTDYIIRYVKIQDLEDLVWAD